MHYMADFETRNSTDCSVWAYGVVDIFSPNIGDSFFYGNNLDEFMALMLKGKGTNVYFHNLNFDGTYVITWLLEHGYVFKTGKLAKGEFSCIASDKNDIYKISVQWGKGRSSRTVFYDSNKLLLSSVHDLGEMIGDVTKGEIDYNKIRESDYEADFDEIDYLRRDCIIAAMALNRAFALGIDGITIGASALSEFKKTIGKDRFERFFPVIDASIDADIRDAYRGGFNLLAPKYVGKEVGEGISLDFNGIYYHAMDKCPMPVGYPKKCSGKIEPTKLYPLYVQTFTCIFQLKEGGIPFIKIDHDLRFDSSVNQYSSQGEEVELTLSSIDLELFFENYDVTIGMWQGGYAFRAETGLFSSYVTKWCAVKEECTRTGNIVGRKMAKRMLTSLVGKFGTRRTIVNRIPELKNGILKFTDGESRPQDKGYVPVSIFTNAYARQIEILAAKKHADRFIYGDTDSLHLIGTELPDLPIDNVKTGCWKIEHVFERAKYLRKKCYIKQIDGEIAVTITGMPYDMHNQVTFENFKHGTTYHGKKSAVRVKGGVRIISEKFVLKYD